jgi:sterol desaturase/sphingolipid hydroxylase (fatty acid hydroxylase superfamily)
MTVLGPVTLGVHDWAAPRPGQPRMFNHPFFEWFTGTRPRTLACIFLPASAYFGWAGLAAGWSPAAAGLLFAAGVALWTFIEYLMHRFLFHLTPRHRLGVVFGYLIHGVHHAFPEDRRRWLMPPIVSVPVAAGFFVALRPLLGAYFAPMFAGGLLGYLGYDLLHYAVHAGSLRGRLPRYLREHHLTHHYRTPESRFGVSTPVWDRVFGTLR